MNFKFTIKRLLILTTVVAALLGIAVRLKLFSMDWRNVGMLALCFAAYLFTVLVFFGRRYFCEWTQFRKSLSELKAARQDMEQEAMKRRDAHRKKQQAIIDEVS